MQHLLLLHGAIGSKEQLFPLAKVLREKYTVHTLNFTGHGGENIPEEPFSIELFAKDVLRYMDQHNIEHTSLFGYSMGGYVAMYLQKNIPKRSAEL